MERSLWSSWPPSTNHNVRSYNTVCNSIRMLSRNVLSLSLPLPDWALVSSLSRYDDHPSQRGCTAPQKNKKGPRLLYCMFSMTCTSAVNMLRVGFLLSAYVTSTNTAAVCLRTPVKGRWKCCALGDRVSMVDRRFASPPPAGMMIRVRLNFEESGDMDDPPTERYIFSK